MKPAVEARCKAAGLWPAEIVRAWGESFDAYEARKRARADMIRAAVATVTLPWMGCNAGRLVAGETDVADLWQVIQAIRQRRRAYLAAIDAPAEEAGISAIAVEPERFETRADDAPADLRSPEERADDARRRWVEIEDCLNKVKAVGFVLRLVVRDEPVAGPLPRVLRFLKEGLDKRDLK